MDGLDKIPAATAEDLRAFAKGAGDYRDIAIVRVAAHNAARRLGVRVTTRKIDGGLLIQRQERTDVIRGQ